jgi:hypothetical protein
MYRRSPPPPFFGSAGNIHVGDYHHYQHYHTLPILAELPALPYNTFITLHYPTLPELPYTLPLMCITQVQQQNKANGYSMLALATVFIGL